MSRAIDWEPTPPWMEHAACKGLTALFFPKRGADPSEYEEAETPNTTDGIRGGETPGVRLRRRAREAAA